MIKDCGFYPAEIYLPENGTDMTRYSVIACDQYTSNEGYWTSVRKTVGDSTSTLNMILPEIYLEHPDKNEKIGYIHASMDEYLSNGCLKSIGSGYIYVERSLPDGNIRRGLVGMVDLDLYDFNEGSKSLIRATEGTVLERIPPRLEMRRGAALELPHIMLLIDDAGKSIIEAMNGVKNGFRKIYDFDLMLGAGHIAGYQVSGTYETIIQNTLLSLANKSKEASPLLYAAGDGNHSLATAKRLYEEKCRELNEDEKSNHPSRYALCEIVNLHDDSLCFEAIHRVIFDCEPFKLIEALKSITNENPTGESEKNKIEMFFGADKQTFYVDDTNKLTVGVLQDFLDVYLSANKGKIDYIHGYDELVKLSEQNNTVGFILPAIDKNDFFPMINKNGALPRKTFSMGEADSKRFYLEAREII